MSEYCSKCHLLVAPYMKGFNGEVDRVVFKNNVFHARCAPEETWMLKPHDATGRTKKSQPKHL